MPENINRKTNFQRFSVSDKNFILIIWSFRFEIVWKSKNIDLSWIFKITFPCIIKFEVTFLEIGLLSQRIQTAKMFVSLNAFLCADFIKFLWIQKNPAIPNFRNLPNYGHFMGKTWKLWKNIFFWRRLNFLLFLFSLDIFVHF